MGEEHPVPAAVYYRTFAALIVLLLITAGASYLPLGALGIAVALGIAATKALLILLNFMHVRYRSRLTDLFAATGFFWLGILFVLTLSDYISRGWPHVPGK
jgi:cytochrome c oxidase subunit 4